MEMIKIVALFASYMLLGAGIFCTIVGVLNGFGDPGLSSKLLWVAGGILAACAGLYIGYRASGKSFSKMFDVFISWL